MEELDQDRRIRELEAALEGSERRYSELLRALDHLPSGIEIYDHTGVARYLNPAMVEMTSLPSAEIALGRFNILTDPFSAETGLKPLYERAYAGEVVRTDEFVIEMERASDDWGTGSKQVWFKMVLVPLFDKNASVESVFAIMFETTEERRLSKALKLASRRDGIEVLAGGVAHDYNNLLTAIMTNSDLVREITADDDLAVLNEDILRASEQAVFLTRQLLDYTRKTAERVETLDLSALTKSITLAFRSTLHRHGQLHMDIPDVPHLAEVDGGGFKQVVMNLLTNAMQSLSGDDGAVRVKLDEVDFDADGLAEFEFSSPPEPGRWHILEIEDNGCGMSSDVRARIFEPFFTTKEHGSGLGLTSTLNIIWGHRGGVSIRSAADVGTSFRIALPISMREAIASTSEDLPASLPDEARVLVVDSSPYLRGSLRALLEHLGFIVEEASDGRGALQRMQQAVYTPDLLLMEVMLPGLNGIDVLRQLRQDTRDHPVLLMSTHGELGLSSVADDPRCGFIEKPFARTSLLREVAKLLGAVS